MLNKPKRATLLALSLALSSVASAQTYTADFSTDNGGFTAKNNTDVTSDVNGLNFVSNNGQGGGVGIDAIDALGLGSSTSDLLANPLYFDFSVRVPVTDPAKDDELGIYYGPESNMASSSAVLTGQDQNGFTLYFNDGSLYGVQKDAPLTLIMSGLTENQVVGIQVEYQMTAAQNPNEYNSFAVVTAQTESGTIQSSGPFTLAGAQAKSFNDINNFTFNGVATASGSGVLSDFTVSTTPITVPEPSSSLLLLGAFTVGLTRRRRS